VRLSTTLAPRYCTIYHAKHHGLHTQNFKTPSKNEEWPRRKKILRGHGF